MPNFSYGKCFLRSTCDSVNNRKDGVCLCQMQSASPSLSLPFTKAHMPPEPAATPLPALTVVPKTHWKQLGDNRFIGVWTLPNGDDLTVTIASIHSEILALDDNQPKEHRILQLVGHKPMILNVTNAKSIHKLYGPFIEDWAGQQITLFASTALLEEEMVECLRIRPTIPRQAKLALSNARLAKALEQIKAGQYTMSALRAKFDLSADQEAVITFHSTKAS